MSNLAFDTHKFVKNLTKTGMKADQAEVLADTYADLLNDRLATKDDILLVRKDMEALEERLTGKMEAQEERLTGKIESVEERLTGKMESQEERLTGKIEKAQMRTVIMVTGILGFLIVVLQFYG